CDVALRRGIRHAIKQAEAEEKKARGHSAEEEVFERRLPRACAALVKGGEDVEREREQLQRKEDDEQVSCCREEHHSAGGGKDEEDVFAHVMREVRVGCEEQDNDGDCQD